MAVATFDTLKFADTLKAGGVPPSQAEAQARAMGDVIQVNLRDLVTKDDLERAVSGLKRDLSDEIASETNKLSLKLAELNTKIEVTAAKNASDNYLTRWMLGATLSGVTALVIRMFFMRPGL